jgi:hypothetical protein
MPGQMFKVAAMNNQETLLDYGDGSSTNTFDATVLWLDAADDIVVGRSVFEHSYSNGNLYNATLSLCCRAAGNQNGNFGVKLATNIDTVFSGPSLRSLGSPVIQTLPLAMIDALPLFQTFSVAAVSSAGIAGRGNLQWSVAPPTFYAAGAVPPTGVTVNPNFGNVSVNTTAACANGGLCPDLDLVLIVADGFTRSSVDLTIAFLAPGSAAPSLTLVAPPVPHPLAGAASSILGGLPPVTSYTGIALSLTFLAGSASRVGFQYNTLPPGGRALPPNGLSQSVTWVPGAAGPGAVDEQYLCGAAVLLASGGGGARRPRSAPLCFNVRLAPDAPPAFSLPTALAYDIVLNQPFQVSPPPTPKKDVAVGAASAGASCLAAGTAQSEPAIHSPFPFLLTFLV